jgi:hypothetical protein
LPPPPPTGPDLIITVPILAPNSSNISCEDAAQQLSQQAIIDSATQFLADATNTNFTIDLNVSCPSPPPAPPASPVPPPIEDRPNPPPSAPCDKKMTQCCHRGKEFKYELFMFINGLAVQWDNKEDCCYINGEP